MHQTECVSKERAVTSPDPLSTGDTIMKRKTLAISVALFFTMVSLGIGSAIAQEAASSSPMDQLASLTGDGTCTGNLLMAMGKTPAHATTAKYHGEKTLDGHWIVIRYDEDQSATNPKPFHVQQYFGYDADAKRYIAVAFDNSGMGYSTGTSGGWKGDTFTVDEHESMGDKAVSYRDVFTRAESGMSGHTGIMKDKSGKWVKTDEETCKSS